MKEWKNSKSVCDVYEYLYKSADPDDEQGDTYISLIVNSVFATEKERTKTNGIWVQSVFESIFDVKNLSTKIDTETVENWTETLTDTEMVIIDYSI